MTCEIYIDGKKIFLEEGFSTSIDRSSPWIDLDSIVTGGYSFDLKVPFGKNRITFRHAERLEVANVKAAYTCRLYSDGEMRMNGTAILLNSEADAADNGFYRISIVDNTLAQTLERPLSELLTKVVNLGSTTAAIIAGAKAQNAAAMSTNGSTGAVMKFVPHFNPDFYGDNNPDFYPSANEYSGAAASEKQNVEYQVTENDFLKDINNPSYVFVSGENFNPTASTQPMPLPVDTGIYYNPNGLWDEAVVYRVPEGETGLYKMRFQFTWRNNSGTNGEGMFVTLRTNDIDGAGAIKARRTFTADSGETRTDFLMAYVNLVPVIIEGEELLHTLTQTITSDVDCTVLFASLTIVKVEEKFNNPPMLFKSILNQPADRPPERSALWLLNPRGILNDWDDFNQRFYFNPVIEGTDYDDVNRSALVPWLQLHSIIRNLAEAIGYDVSGDYMADAIEQRALVHSNLALDKTSGTPTLAYVGAQDFRPSTTGNVKIGFDNEQGVFNNENNLWNVAETRYEIPSPGVYKVKLVALHQRVNTGASTVFVQFYKSDTFNAANRISKRFFGEEIEFLETGNINAEFFFVAEEGDDYIIPVMNQSLAGGQLLVDASLEVYDILQDNVNLYEGQVRWADHTPDISASDLLKELKKTKCLNILFNPLQRRIDINYLKTILETAPEAEVQPLAVRGRKNQSYIDRRFELQYGNLPDDLVQVSPLWNEMDPVNTSDDLPAPENALDAVLVRNESAWYVVRKHEYFNKLVWKRAGSHYPLLRVQAEGERYPITPELGPVAMSTVVTRNRFAARMPHLSGAGRSSMFDTRGARPPLRMCYWLGIDSSSLMDGYPLATTTARNMAGTVALSRDMQWLTLFNLHWKPLLQMLVLEQRVTAYFRFRPDQRRLADFARVLSLGGVPVIPIRTGDTVGGNGLTEVEMRKVKAGEVKVVGDVLVEIPQPEEIWTPAEYNELLIQWIDPSKLTLGVDADVDYIGDLSGNENSISGNSNLPKFKPQYLNGRGVLQFSSGNQLDFDNHNGFPSGINAGQSNYLIALIRPTGLSSSGRHTFWRFGSSSVNLQFEVGMKNSSFGDTEPHPYIFSGRNARVLGHDSQNNSWAMVIFAMTDRLPSDFYVRINGGSNQSATVSGSNQNISYTPTQGRVGGGVFEGQIGEFIYFSKDATLQQLEDIEGYFAHKYGLNDLLPSGHSRKNAPPEL